ncbi:MAG: citramalate synthase [Deltaproteobacteria bacterium]|uniref:Citramalate synthase n=1 Tax=Candidatus Zymogenus saltonus TaxID=2844893 RepID=A0A9D8KHW2_9DELT|nr:citramalate synthase [Candidatus Zymogenus saltonus]
MRLVKIYDTTLRDGAQAEDISFIAADKIRIAKKLDELGVHYIEGGWPGANPRDNKFFKGIKGTRFNIAKLVAFGSTRRAGKTAEKDSQIKALLDAETDAITIVGKSWDIHVTQALGVELKENLDMIYDTFAYLKDKTGELFFDAEHFFDGFKANPDYALETLKRAESAGASSLILCDTNGGVMPWDLKEIIERVVKEVSIPFGIHCHNDNGLALANTLTAVQAGAVQVQGTINGIGERCGNADICSIIPNLKLKMDIECISDQQMERLKEVSRFVDEMANRIPNKHYPYVGESAFAHKGGIHASAVSKNPLTYEHVNPALVGNRQRILVSDQSGLSNIKFKAKQFGVDLTDEEKGAKELVKNVKDLEEKGYQFEGADASFELLMNRTLGRYKPYFRLRGFRVIVERRQEDDVPFSEATIMIDVDGRVEHTAAVGNGPVNALDNAIRKALMKFYPELSEMRLVDFKVRVLTTEAATAGTVRVLIESGDNEDTWETVGVHENIIQASWTALVDSIEYKLYKDEKKRKALEED